MLQFSDIFKEFLSSMNKLTDSFSFDAKKVLKDICNFLCISRIDTVFYANSSAFEKKQGTNYLLYSSDIEYNEDIFIIKRFENHVKNIIEYIIYRDPSSPSWDKKALERIDFFIETLFVYNSRSQLIKIASNYTYRDEDLDVYNLPYYMQHVAHIIRKGQINNYFGVYFNLKGFSVINHRFGRDKGTRIMRQYLKNLLSDTEEDEIVCRIGGDNFVGIFLKKNMKKIKEYLRSASAGKDDKGCDIIISAIVGLYEVNGSEITRPADLMDKISTAFHEAKSKGCEIVFFDKNLMKDYEHTKWVESQFPYALDAEEFKVYYQPKVDLHTNEIVGAEALCRWLHDGQLVPPFKFIPVLEQTLNICTLDFYMLDHVCKDIHRWLDSGKKAVRISVNMSRRHLGDALLLDHIIDVIDRNKIPHEYIEIELTETTTDVEFKDLKKVVNGLHDSGIYTSVDDFGIGYSSLNLIRDIPWDVLKIDRSFLPTDNDIDLTRKDTMLKHVINMSQSLGLECIVEGVETADHVELLKKNSCFLAQGFYFDRPLPKEEFEVKLLNI